MWEIIGLNRPLSALAWRAGRARLADRLVAGILAALGVRQLADNHVELYGAKMLQQRLSASPVTLGRKRGRSRDLAEPFRQFLRLEQETIAAVLSRFGQISSTRD